MSARTLTGPRRRTGLDVLYGLTTGSAELLPGQPALAILLWAVRGTDRRTLQITQRRIPYVKVGKYVRLQRSALDAFVDAGRIPTQE